METIETIKKDLNLLILKAQNLRDILDIDLDRSLNRSFEIEGLSMKTNTALIDLNEKIKDGF